MKVTAVAPANIAFIKYWGKKNAELRLPLNSSISMNLSNCQTITTVEFSDDLKEDYFEFIPDNHRKKTLERNFAINDKEKLRAIKHLDRIRKLAGIKVFAKVVSRNNFPKSSGIASSASGFAALTVAGCAAADVDLPERELTVLARAGSGSACRSIPDGFVEWQEGDTGETSYAFSLHKASHWDLRDIILLVSENNKKISSAKGMENVWSSPLMEKRLAKIEERIKKVTKALKNKNFHLLGLTIEEEANEMHAVMESQNTPLFYRTKKTMEIINAVQKWREEGLMVFFTIDAGPNVHLICQGKDETKVISKIKEFDKGLKLIINKPSTGARIINKHLF